jgi:hypothetical protein
MNAVRHNDVPVDDAERYREIDADTKAALLHYGAACEAVVDAAREQERSAQLTMSAVLKRSAAGTNRLFRMFVCYQAELGN